MADGIFETRSVTIIAELYPQGARTALLWAAHDSVSPTSIPYGRFLLELMSSYLRSIG